MKKLLVGSAAIALGLALVSPAQAADGVKLGIGGYFKGYMGWVDQDEPTGENARNIDMLRDTEIHFTGETTLDNGLTVGAHTELADDLGDGFAVDESYAYFSGGWGRVNFGAEDGAAYLLQVAAPSADSNFDGLRQYVQPFNYFTGGQFSGLGTTTLATAGGGTTFTNVDELFNFDYDQDITGSSDKITYLTPVFSGFQAGASYTPKVSSDSRGLDGVNLDDQVGEYSDAWDVALRYAGQFDGWGLTAGAGYSHSNLETDTTVFFDTDADGVLDAGEVTLGDLDDRAAWNAGAVINFSAFNIGAVYTHDDLGIDDDASRKTWVVGADYTTGPFKLGVSYYDQNQELGTGNDELETTRYTGGVTYTFGPGMTFRGSVNHTNLEIGSDDVDGTGFLLGTQIDF
ncbi:MAG: porin [Gallionellaceae bacterium]